MTIAKLDLREERIAGAVWRLQHAAYAAEAQWIGASGIPPLTDTTQTLRQCGETFYGAMDEEGELVAAASIETQSGIVAIRRMMVHPAHYRKGLAGRLLAHIEDHAGPADTFIVSAASANVPAVGLYKAMGYRARREWETVYGLKMTELVKQAAGVGPA